MNFIFESLENLNVNEIEKVCGVIHIVHTNVYFVVRTKHWSDWDNKIPEYIEMLRKVWRYQRCNQKP